MYGKTLYIYDIYDILYKTFINDKDDKINTDYICPDYFADETTITENTVCNYNMDMDTYTYNIIQNKNFPYQVSCIDCIIFFIVLNLCCIILFVCVEQVYILFNMIMNKLFNINFDLLTKNTKNTDKISKEIDTNEIYHVPICKDDMEDFFNNYSEIIKIQQYLNKDDNLDKVLLFYKESNNFFQQTLDILNDKYRNVFLDKQMFLNYYKNENDGSSISKDAYLKFINMTNDKYIYTSCKDKISVNLNKLYESEQLMVDISLFNINNNKKYFPLKKGQLCYITNLSKLNFNHF